MLTLDQIQRALRDRRIDVVAKATGIHRNTISAIRDGRNKNPTYYIIRKLSDYLSGGHDAS